MFYKISDPEKGLLSVGDETAVAKLIKDTSIATLQSIMRSSGLNQVAQSKHVHAVSGVFSFLKPLLQYYYQNNK